MTESPLHRLNGPRRVIFVYHLKRSGGHAVINWIMENMRGTEFVNNAIPIQAILLGEKEIPKQVASFDDWLRSEQITRERSLTIEQSETLLVSLEDHSIDLVPFAFPRNETLVIVRLAESLFASRIRKASQTHLKAYDYADKQVLKRTIELWKEHARSVLRQQLGSGDVKTVLYDAWLLYQSYRERVSSSLGIDNPTPPSGRPTERGGGSSFGGKASDPTELVRRSNFLNRRERKILTEIMSDPEIRDLQDHLRSIVDSEAAASLSHEFNERHSTRRRDI